MPGIGALTLKESLPKQGMAWHLRPTITGMSRWDMQICRAFEGTDVNGVLVGMKKRPFQTYLTNMFDAALDLVLLADEDTSLEEFCRVFGRADKMATKLMEIVVAGARTQEEREAAPAKAEHIFVLFFDAVVKGRGRFFQRRVEAGLPARPPNAVNCLLALAVDRFELAAPFYQWDLIQPLVAVDVEALDPLTEICFDDHGEAVARPINPAADIGGDQFLAQMMDAVEVDTADAVEDDAMDLGE